MAPIEINPKDAKDLGIESGDVVEVYNDFGSTFAMAYLEPDLQKSNPSRQSGGVQVRASVASRTTVAGFGSPAAPRSRALIRV